MTVVPGVQTLRFHELPAAEAAIGIQRIRPGAALYQEIEALIVQGFAPSGGAMATDTWAAEAVLS